MRERPIPFSPKMVAAIRRAVDPKTQTRRVIVPQPEAVFGHGVASPKNALGLRSDAFGIHARIAGADRWIYCPHGKPDDRLWVRERHCYLDVSKSAMSTFPGAGPHWTLTVEYSDGFQLDKLVEGDKPKQTRQRGETGWRPPMFMHRWAARTLLEVTDVRVERLQDLSEEDAKAEGVEYNHARFHDSIQSSIDNTAIRNFAVLWHLLNKKRGYGWDANPWVWAITFKRIS